MRNAVYHYLQAGNSPIIVLLFLGLLCIAYALNWIVTFEPMSAGSGIPQVKGKILGLMEMNWLRVLISKFIGGVLAIGAGLSLGREGPSIQLGATIGQGLSQLFNRTKLEERYLVTSGASAGLAAAFNAPLAGVVFSLEELHKNFSPTVLMSAVAAALTAAVVTQHFFGVNPVFNFNGLPIFPISYYGYIILLGIVIGLLGVAFNRVLIKTLNTYEKQKLLSGMGKAALPLVTAGIIGFILPDVLGGGNNLVNELSAKSFSITILCILLAAKFFFTMLSYGSGVPGGIFLPMLVIGALAGSVFSHIVIQIGNLDSCYSTNIIVLSMAAYFSAVVKAPITGSILIMEMTGSFNHILSLIVVSMTSYFVADIFKIKPIYEELLERSLSKQGKVQVNMTSKKRVIVELAICIGSKLEGREIKNIDWPPQCLLISIKRGDSELVPKGDTRIQVGDYLYILANVDQEKQIHDLAKESI
ncbi:ClC family H(+)/Cl(-) exchange transporter [Sporomusa acidovorans]|uniref:ClC family H(+)/Cl(-) exchange transporter n=1 Tax=Sporomusa acidovorans TaxID=112900 RepID=UPI001FDF948E|nr:ClC family H(+)/Cl(-) exchange transporter [Sporomusa acidovorans]